MLCMLSQHKVQTVYSFSSWIKKRRNNRIYFSATTTSTSTTMTKTNAVPLKNVTQWMIVGTFVGNNSLFSRTKQYEPFYQTIENELIRALIITIRSHQVTTETRCHSRSKAWVSERRKKKCFFEEKIRDVLKCVSIFIQKWERERKKVLNRRK